MTAVVNTTAGVGAPASAHPVNTPSGQTIEVLGPAEVAFYEGQARLYQDQNSFTNAADLQDLDRLIFLELMVFRATSWLGSGKDYFGFDLTDRAKLDAQKALKENSALLTQVKNDLGMTKSQRDKAAYESVGTYLEELKVRAKEFGVHREKQTGAAIALMKQLYSIVGAYKRSDEAERKKIGFESADDVLDWITDVMQPEFDQIDAYFVANQQRYWKQV